MSNAYMQISPRGFANETYIVVGSLTAIETASSIINDDVSAWARRLPESSSEVRRAKRDAERYGDPIPTLSETDVTRHRPIYLHDDGSRSPGRAALPPA